MKKCAAFLILFGFIFEWVSAQQVLLYTEDFESPGTEFVSDTGWTANPEVGTNTWIVNDQFDGASVYPNTPNQDSTTSGTIGGAPFSNYLHIHDETLAPVPSNANFNGANASDRFAYMSGGFCTLGIDSVILTFFWIGEGSSDAWGEVYYSIDRGPWIQTGQAQYQGRSKWKFESFSNPDFANKANIRFGFRWQNGNSGVTDSISFGIDDIIIVGTYDDVVDPIEINIENVFPSPLCQQEFLIIEWSLSEPLCQGTYRVELSNAAGGFNNPGNMGVFNIADLDTSGFISIQIPRTQVPSQCYRVRINRIGPPPFITGLISDCFVVEDCPNTITTLTPVVATDPDTLCSRSAIDVPFMSTGVFFNNNVYTAQLSDSSGSFDNPEVIGTLPSNETFDPAIGAMPGTVSGLVPIVPEGCNYFIRVISSSPSVTGSTFGPFCIKHCDILTNETMDLQFCIRENEGMQDTIPVDIHTWDNIAQYFQGNEFQVQLLDMMTLGLVNQGGIGVKADTTSTSLVIDVPGLNALLNLGIAPGTYYLRIVADSSSVPTDLLGSIVRITIGAPADNPAFIITEDSVSCNVGVLGFEIVPYNPDSDWEWLSTGLNNGQPFIWPFNPLLVDFTGAPVDDYTFRVREINYGCFGPYSDPVTVDIISTPEVSITGPIEVCLGDTVQFEVPFLLETFYEWDASWGDVADVSNNEFSLSFDSIGVSEISIFALNECGTQNGTYEIEVISLIDVQAGPDLEFCKGDSITLNASIDAFENRLSSGTDGTDSTNGCMFDVRALSEVTIQTFDAHLSGGAGVNIEIYTKAGSHIGFEEDASAWQLLTAFNGLTPQGAGILTQIPLPIGQVIEAGQTQAFYITINNGQFMRFSTPGLNPGDVFATDGIIEMIVGSANLHAFGPFISGQAWDGAIDYTTFGGFEYSWSNGQQGQEIRISPEESNLYIVRVSDTTGCGNNDSVFVSVNEVPTVELREDTTACLEAPVILNAQASNSFFWTPTEGLNDPNSLNPIATPINDITYVLTVIDSVNGCQVIDSMRMTVRNCIDPIKVPQAFSPNQDGNNDFFTVFGEAITSYEIKIFNRWGELVYSSSDESELNDLSRGWDGRYKGKLQNTGTFVYYIRATDVNGQQVEKQGNLALIR